MKASKPENEKQIAYCVIGPPSYLIGRGNLIKFLPGSDGGQLGSTVSFESVKFADSDEVAIFIF